MVKGELQELRIRLQKNREANQALRGALNVLMDAIHPSTGAGFPDSVLPAYDEARAVVQKYYRTI